MKKTIWIIITILLVAFLQLSVTTPVYAAQTKDTSVKGDNTRTNVTPNLASEECNKNNNTLLGDPNCPSSVAWLVHEIMQIIKIAGPVLVIILSSIDFAQIILSGDDQAMAKAQKKLVIRIILAVGLFFIPTLIEVILDLFDLTSGSISGLV